MKFGTEPGVREIVLTFDDGPNPKTTPKLLDLLAAEGIHAVFFVLGERIATPTGRAVMERAHKEGHMIGNHSFSHPNLRKLTKAKIIDEIKRTHDLITATTGGANLFRPPYGSMNKTVTDVIHDLGYSPVMWNVDTLDWKFKTDGKWVSHGMSQIKKNEDSVVLMHDIHATTVNNVNKLLVSIRKLGNTKFVLYD